MSTFPLLQQELKLSRLLEIVTGPELSGCGPTRPKSNGRNSLPVQSSKIVVVEVVLGLTDVVGPTVVARLAVVVVPVAGHCRVTMKRLGRPRFVMSPGIMVVMFTTQLPPITSTGDGSSPEAL